MKPQTLYPPMLCRYVGPRSHTREHPTGIEVLVPCVNNTSPSKRLHQVGTNPTSPYTSVHRKRYQETILTSHRSLRSQETPRPVIPGTTKDGIPTIKNRVKKKKTRTEDHRIKTARLVVKKDTPIKGKKKGHNDV